MSRVAPLLVMAVVVLLFCCISSSLASNVQDRNSTIQPFLTQDQAPSSCVPESWSWLLQKGVIIIHVPEDNGCQVEILRCYCLTSEVNTSNHSLNLYFGHCLYGCFKTDPTKEYYTVSIIPQRINDSVCAPFNRTGILCGQCVSGYGPPAYSFSLKCVPCENGTRWHHIPYYVLVAYGPLTVFLVMIVVFTVSVNSAPLHGWIFVCQIVTEANIMRIFISVDDFHTGNHYSPYVQIFGSLYGIWNLDFFRSVYRPFCIHSSLTTLQVMSLDYIIAAYPLVIIVIMYVLVDLHSRDCGPVVVMWRPFHYCFARFRHQLNIRTSLVDAFGTFFSLSYIKFVSTTFDLIATTQVWSDSSKPSSHVYFDGTVQSFKHNHIPIAVLGVSVFSICNILPLVLILLYSFRKTHAFLRLFPASVQAMLFPFMDNILACYKDGTHGTRNCRYFAVVYHLAFIILLTSFMWTESTSLLTVYTYIGITVGMLVAVIQPYKSAVYNTVDTILVLTLGLTFAGATSSFISYINDPMNKGPTAVMAIFPLVIPLFYLLGFSVFQMCIRKKRLQRVVCFTYIHVKESLCFVRSKLEITARRVRELDSLSEHSGLVP